MAPVGFAGDDPANAQLVAYLTRRPTRAERVAAIATLTRLEAKTGSALLARSLRRLAEDRPDPPRPASQAPEGIDLMTLGALPDIVERLWRLGLSLPADCRWVAYGRAMLCHPETGIAFGLALGTFGIALRLPAEGTPAALAAGGTQNLSYRSGQGRKTLSMLQLGSDWWLFRGVGAPDDIAFLAYQYWGKRAVSAG